jgi:micrococcal nuclease
MRTPHLMSGLVIATAVGAFAGSGITYALMREPAQEAVSGHVVPGVKKVSPSRSKSCTVDRVIDGDTLKANCDSTGLITIRVIGIDTPEKGQCYADKATAEADRLMPKGSQIKITQDLTQDPKDRYGRTLAYVTFRADDISAGDWGLWAVQWGYAKEYTYKVPYARQKAYRDAQSTALDDSYGMWGACTW